MKLQEILQEGVFDSIRTERKATDLSALTKLTPQELGKFLKTLPDDKFQELSKHQFARYRRMEQVFNDVGGRIRDIEKEYPYDAQVYWGSGLKDGFNLRRFDGPARERGVGRKTQVQVRAGSEAEKEINALVREYKHYDRIRKEASLSEVIQVEDKRRVKLARQKANKAAVGSFEEWKQMSPNPSTVDTPTKLPKSSGAKNSLKNPAAYPRAAEVYTGHPAHFPNWRSDWKRRLLALEDALVRNGKKGFHVMYSAKLSSYFNFFIIGADGDFVWRKYQTSSANGMNWLYIDGKQIQTSIFERMSPEKQDELISTIP